MTNWQMHIMIVMVIAIGLTVFLEIEDTGRLMFVSAAVLGSLLPDLDHTESKGTRMMYLLVLIAIVVMVFAYFDFDIVNKGLYALGATGVLYLFFHIAYRVIKPSHRGITHSWLFAIAIAGGAYLLTQDVLVAGGVGLGIFGHLIADGILVKFV